MTNQGAEAVGGCPKTAQFGQDRFSQGFDGGEDLVADDVFDLVPDFFRRIEFGAVGRQGDAVDFAQFDPLGFLWRGLVESGSVPEDDVVSCGTGAHDLAQVFPDVLCVECGEVGEDRPAFDHVDRAAEVVPIVFLLKGFDHAVSAQAPAAAHDGVQAKARLIHNPDAYRFSGREVQFSELVFPAFGFEFGDGSGGLAAVAGAGRFQAPFALSQPVVSSCLAELDPVFFDQPLAKLNGGAPGAEAEVFLDLGLDGFAQGGFPSGRVSALDQRVEATSNEFFKPYLDGGSGAAHGFGHHDQGVAASHGHARCKEAFALTRVVGGGQELL